MGKSGVAWHEEDPMGLRAHRWSGRRLTDRPAPLLAGTYGARPPLASDGGDGQAHQPAASRGARPFREAHQHDELQPDDAGPGPRPGVRRRGPGTVPGAHRVADEGGLSAPVSVGAALVGPMGPGRDAAASTGVTSKRPSTRTRTAAGRVARAGRRYPA